MKVLCNIMHCCRLSCISYIKLDLKGLVDRKFVQLILIELIIRLIFLSNMPVSSSFPNVKIHAFLVKLQSTE